MIRQGFIGDSVRLMPIFENIDEEEIDLSPIPEYMADDEDTENVVVPSMPTSSSDKYIKSTDQNVSSSPIGSAGNSLVSSDAEPQLGSVDDESMLGDDETLTDSIGGIGKIGLNESGSVIDDAPMKKAQKNYAENSLTKINDLFNQFAFKPSKSPTFDVDSTKPKVQVAKEPIKRIPKGW